METLVYLISDVVPTLPENGYHRIPRILLSGRKTEKDDEEHLQIFSNISLGRQEEDLFNVLYDRLPVQWYKAENYDIINPFGDDRQIQYRSLWTFDIQRDLLLHTNRDHRSEMPLSRLRGRGVSMADMKPLGGPIPDPLVLKQISGPEISNWKPKFRVEERLRAFLHCLLRDFHYQWRHILRNHFNSTTLRAFATAILRLSTLNFEIQENTGGIGARGVHVWIMDSPLWESLTTEVVQAGNIHIVLCQDIRDGLSMAKQHVSSQDFRATESQNVTHEAESRPDYIVLSVKHIVLCRATGPTSLTHTFPEPLFYGDHGSGSPSDLALDYLIWATSSARPLIVTPLQKLPVEIQDMILNYVSMGTVEAARLGCLLGLGAPFCWKDGSLDVVLQERHLNRPSGSPVESQIWFGEYKSGVVYLAGGHRLLR